MADIESQTLTRVSCGESSKVTLVFDESGWNLPVSRMCGRKEIERRIFRARDAAGGEKWFECGPVLADDLNGKIRAFVAANHIDEARLEEIDIVITRKRDGRDRRYEAAVASRPNRLPRVRLWSRLVAWVRGLLKRERRI